MSRWYANHTPDDDTTITKAEWQQAQTSGSSPNPTAGAPTPEPPADPAHPRGGDGPDLNDLRRILNDVHTQVQAAVRDREWAALNRIHRLEQELADRETCDICAGTGWALIPDPFLDGTTTDQACPLCQDTTIR